MLDKKTAKLSLQMRLGLSLSVAVLVLFVTLGISIDRKIKAAAINEVEVSLQNDNEAIVALMQVAYDGRWLFQPEQLSPVYQRPFSGHYLQIQSATQLFHSRSLWDAQLPLINPKNHQILVQHLKGPLGRPLLAVSMTYRRQQTGTPVSITVARDLTSTYHYIRKVRDVLIGSGIVCLVLLLFIQYLILKRALKPIERISTQLISLKSGDIGRLNEQVPRELVPMVSQINAQLAVLEQRLERSRKGLGNLAHALKTPLAVIVHLAQDLTIPSSLRTTLAERAGDIQKLVNRELKRARLAGGGRRAGQLLHVEPDTKDLLQTLALIYREKAIAVDLHLSPNSGFYGDRQDFMELLGNLCDNAFIWAKKKIRLEISGVSPLRVVVEDDGPGIPSQKRALLLERGKRLDEQAMGSGLGLSIVKDILDLYEGKLQILSSSLGGLKVIVTLN